MGWEMKNFNILGIHRKIQVLREGGVDEKPIYRGGDCLKMGSLDSLPPPPPPPPPRSMIPQCTLCTKIPPLTWMKLEQELKQR